MALPLPPDPSKAGQGEPATRWPTCSPSDTELLPVYPRAVYCEGAGNVRAEDAEGNVGTFVFAAGEAKAIRPRKIYATLTSATGILLLG